MMCRGKVLATNKQTKSENIYIDNKIFSKELQEAYLENWGNIVYRFKVNNMYTL